MTLAGARANDGEVRAPRTLPRLDGENPTPKRDNKDFQAPLDDDHRQAPGGRKYGRLPD